MFQNNPEEFIRNVVKLIKEQKTTMIVEHISDNLIECGYDSSIFTQEKQYQSFNKAYSSKKHITDYVFSDSDGERKFALALDGASEVCVYAKLPRSFQIPTPVGNYAPDLFDFDEKSEYKPIPFALPELPKKKEPLDVLVPMYSNCTDKIGSDINLKDFLLTDKYKDIVEQIRAGATSEERHDLKNKYLLSIPCVTVSGKFSNRDGKHLESHSGLIAIDIDYKDNKEIMSQIPSILQGLPYVAYCSKSISGDGYFAIIPIENTSHFKQHFRALQEEMKKLGIVIDKSCSDITRLRYASYDENPYYNPNATEYYFEYGDDTNTNRLSETKKVKKQEYSHPSSLSDVDILNRELEYLKNNNINIPDDYNTWFNIGMALNSRFGENGRKFFHEFSKFSEKYDESECNQQYDNIVNHYDSDGEITLGTLIHIINETKNKEIKKCA